MPTPPSDQTLTIQVWYFASLAEQADIDEETITLSQAVTLPTLYEQLSQKYGFTLPQSRLAVAINHQICDWNYEIKADDIIAFIPPVAGG